MDLATTRAALARVTEMEALTRLARDAYGHYLSKLIKCTTPAEYLSLSFEAERALIEHKYQPDTLLRHADSRIDELILQVETLMSELQRQESGLL